MLKMKNISIIAAMLLMLITGSGSYAQNYKQPIPSIDAKGKITDVRIVDSYGQVGMVGQIESV